MVKIQEGHCGHCDEKFPINQLDHATDIATQQGIQLCAKCMAIAVEKNLVVQTNTRATK